jgi:hypothetical protein
MWNCEDRKFSLSTYIIILLGAITFGALGSALGSWWGWQESPALPSNAAVTSIVADAGLSLPATFERRDAPFGYDPPLTATADKILVPILGTDGYGPGKVTGTVHGVSQPPASLAAVRSSELRAGWHVQSISGPDDGESFSATRGSVLVTWTEVHPENADGVELKTFKPLLRVEVARSQPAWLRWFVLCCWSVGLVVGGILTLIAVPRYQPWRTSPINTPLLLAGFLLMLPATMLTSLENLPYLVQARPFPYAPEAGWDWYTFVLIRPLFLLGSVTTVLAIVVGIRARRRKGRDIASPARQAAELLY